MFVFVYILVIKVTDVVLPQEKEKQRFCLKSMKQTWRELNYRIRW